MYTSFWLYLEMIGADFCGVKFSSTNCLLIATFCVQFERAHTHSEQ